MKSVEPRPTLSRRDLLCAAAAAACLPRAAHAQPDWPNKPIRLVVPYAPGGSSDTLGRMIARQLGDSLKVSVVVENRAGAGGLIGSQQVSKAAPDGYTLVISGIGSHVIAPVEQPNTFDPIRDFTHIALLGGPPLALVVNAESPYKDFKTFLALAATDARGVSWGSPGQGTHGHLTGELLRAAAKLNMVHIAYKGAGPAVQDLVAGQIPVGCMTLSSANAHVDSGKLRLLAVSSSARVAAYPNAPTLAELGYPQLTGTTWFSISGPPGMPQAVVDRLNTEIRRGLAQPEARQQMSRESMETIDQDAAAFTRYVAAEIARWAPAAKAVSTSGKS